MKIGERLLLVFMTMVFFALVFIIGCCVWYTPFLALFLEFIGYSIYLKIAISAILLILLVLSFRSMLVSTKKAKNNTLMAASTDEGGIYINLDTVSDLAKRAVKKIDGVKELCVKTVVNDEGAHIAVKVSLAPEVVIPEISVAIQQSVKSDIEALCGIRVKKVTIQVDNSLQSQTK
ncbi:MAG: alkaline shock response membrane anchor protein AmaP [Clostridiales bacterium]|nr:alkaline shock response membrane anchor protein AmaP [Clostridiales bacterium]